jgi:hypothetical protein
VTVLALLVIVAAIPYAIMDTIETGRVYLFSRQFLEELPQRFTGPGRFRFILQPILAILLGVRGGMADAKAARSIARGQVLKHHYHLFCSSLLAALLTVV